MRESSAEWRKGLISQLVFISKCAPPVAVGINPMTDWTARELAEWHEATSELNKQIWPDD